MVIKIMDEGVFFSSAKELATNLLSAKIGAADLTEAFLGRINKINKKVNAIVIDNRQQALETARKLDLSINEGNPAGFLHGVPITIKESFNLKGQKTTVNFKMLRENVAAEDAVIVRRLKEAGAVILGKTNVPTLLADNQTFGPIYPTARNPYDTSKTTGGSTGGGAAAVATGMSAFEIGTDIGGSIRNPANFCGLFGMKPTENQFVQSGHVPPLPNANGGFMAMASVGPLARSMDDIDLAWKIINQPEWRYLNSLPAGSRAIKHDSLGDYKIGWFDETEFVGASDSTRKVLGDFIDHLREQGTKIHKFKIDARWLEQTYETWTTLFGFITGQNAPWVLRQIMKYKFGRQTRGSSFNAVKALGKGLSMDFQVFSQTLKIKQELIAQLMDWFDDYDFIIGPTSIGPAFKHNPRHRPIKYEGRTIPYPEYNFPFTLPYNVCGNPTLIVPGGFSSDGLPIGIQIAGPHHSENELIHFGKLVEAQGYKFQPPIDFQ
jgi:amidase